MEFAKQVNEDAKQVKLDEGVGSSDSKSDCDNAVNDDSEENKSDGQIAVEPSNVE